MKRSIRLHVFVATVACVVVFFGASRVVVRLAADKPFMMQISETLVHHAQHELDASQGELDLKIFQTNLEKSIDHLQPGDMLVFSEDSHVGADASAIKDVVISQKLEWEKLPSIQFDTVRLAVDEKKWRVIRFTHQTKQIFVCVKDHVFQMALKDILAIRDAISVQIFPVLVVYIVLTTVLLSYAVLWPLQALKNTFSHIKISGQHSHIHLQSNYREFASFIRYFNALIDRLRASYTLAARFSSDAAHELRTPLTIIRGHLNRLINQVPDGSGTQIQLSFVAEEVERLISIANKLLFLSQADAGHLGLEKQDLNINDMVGQMMDDLKSFSPELIFTRDIKDVILIKADHDLIFQLMNNLLSNAIKYNHPQGCVDFKARVNKNALNFSIVNSTNLTLDGLDDRVFDRFYRHREAVGQAVSGATGSGLGLSLCREIVNAHGGVIHLSVTPNNKVCIECTLPMA